MTDAISERRGLFQSAALECSHLFIFIFTASVVFRGSMRYGQDECDYWPGSHDIGDESWKDAAMRAPGSIAMICVGDLQ
jgi:hypothetical protein